MATQTSIKTYHSLDFSTLRGQIAIEIRRINKEFGPAYISQVAFNLGLEKSTVSARFNELRFGENAKKNNPEMVIKPFLVGKKWYKVKHAGQHRMPDPKTPQIKRLVDTWAIVECEAPAQQTSLFQ